MSWDAAVSLPLPPTPAVESSAPRKERPPGGTLAEEAFRTSSGPFGPRSAANCRDKPSLEMVFLLSAFSVSRPRTPFSCTCAPKHGVGEDVGGAVLGAFAAGKLQVSGLPLPSVAQDPVVKLDVEDEALKVEQQELAKPLGNRPLLASLSKADSNEVLGNSIFLGLSSSSLFATPADPASSTDRAPA